MPSNTAQTAAPLRDQLETRWAPKLEGQTEDANTHTTTPAIPANAPSIVLPGLIAGASLFLPKIDFF